MFAQPSQYFWPDLFFTFHSGPIDCAVRGWFIGRIESYLLRIRIVSASAQPHLLRPTALFAAHALQFAKLFDDTVLTPTTTTTTGAAGTAAGSSTTGAGARMR